MTSPDDFKDLEERLSRALRSRGDSIEPSSDAYSRLARAVNDNPGRFPRVRGLFGPIAGSDGLSSASSDSIRPLIFVTAVLAVAALGGYSLFSLSSSPTDTVTAAPATADAADFVPGRDDSTSEAESITADSESTESAEATSGEARLADIDDNAAQASVPTDSTPAGTATSIASNPVEEFAGLTYAPVRITRLEAAEAFLGLLGIDGLTLEEADDVVIVGPPGAGIAESTNDAYVVTVLDVEEIGDGFMVVGARSDRLDIEIAGLSTDDPTDDDIADAAVAVGPIELSGSAASPLKSMTVSLRSVVDGTALVQTVVPTEPGDATNSYELTIPVSGAERVWVVATAVDPVRGEASLAARPVLYVGVPDSANYTVVGLPPDDPDGGLVVRSTPNGEQVGVIGLGTTDVRRRAVPPRAVDGLTWWAIEAADGLEGWAAARYLAVDETPADSALIELARRVIQAGVEGDTTSVDDLGVTRPVFVGTIDNPRPVSGLSDVAALLTTRRRLVNGEDGSSRLADAFGFDRWADAEVFIPKGYRQQGAAEGARAFFGDLPSVVIRSRNPETGGWERVHLFVSRDGDRPTLVGMALELEPNPGTADGTADTSPAPSTDDGQ